MFDLLKPAWKSKNLEVRRKAVCQLSSELQPKKLEVVILEDEDFQNRMVALKEIKSEESLKLLLKKLDKKKSFRENIEKHLESILLKNILKSQSFSEVEKWLLSIKNKHSLEKIVLKHTDFEIRAKALSLLTEESSFYQILLQITDSDLALDALDQVSNEQYLKTLSQKAKIKSIRSKLKILFRSKEKQKFTETIIDDFVKVEWILNRVKNLSVLEDQVMATFSQITDEWDVLKIKVNSPEKEELMKKYCQDFLYNYQEYLESQREKERELQLLDPDTEFLNFQGQFDDSAFLEKSDKENENKKPSLKPQGSSQQTLDFVKELIETLKQIEKLLQNKVFPKIQFDCLKLLRRVAEITQMKLIRQHGNFEDLFDRYQQYSKQFYDLQSWFHWSNLKLKTELCEEIKKSIKEDYSNQEFVNQQYLLFQKKWRLIGVVSYSEKEKIQEMYQQSMNNFQEKYQNLLAASLQDQKEILLKKERLCEVVEAYAEVEDWSSTIKALKQYQIDWKELSSVEGIEEQRLWKRFRTANDILFSEYSKYLKEIRGQQDQNLKVKKDYFNEVEQLAGFRFEGDLSEFLKSQDWQESLQRVKTLQQQWKLAGSGGRQDYKLWQRFQIACNYVFDISNSDLESDLNFEENLKLKQSVVEEMVKVVDQTISDSQWERIKTLQRQWSKIGPIDIQSFKELNSKLLSVMKKMYKNLDALQNN